VVGSQRGHKAHKKISLLQESSDIDGNKMMVVQIDRYMLICIAPINSEVTKRFSRQIDEISEIV